MTRLIFKMAIFFAVMLAVSVIAPVYADASKPLILIRFNQKYVYFQEPLKKVVNAVNEVQSGATYEVQSIVPQNIDGDKANANLGAVLAELRQLGVMDAQVHATTSVATNIKSQEIKIFIK